MRKRCEQKSRKGWERGEDTERTRARARGRERGGRGRTRKEKNTYLQHHQPGSKFLYVTNRHWREKRTAREVERGEAGGLAKKRVKHVVVWFHLVRKI